MAAGEKARSDKDRLSRKHVFRITEEGRNGILTNSVKGSPVICCIGSNYILQVLWEELYLQSEGNRC